MAVKDKSKIEVKSFFALTILFSWLFWLCALLMQKHNHLSFAGLLIRCGSFVPSILGVALSYLFGGKEETRLLLRSTVSFRIYFKWLLFIFFVLPGVSAISCLIFSALGGVLPRPQFSPLMLPAAFVYILIFMGPLGEEAGWRGFALKRTLQYLSPINAALVIGAIWSLWHLPLFFIEGTIQKQLSALGRIPVFAGYFIYTVMFSALITLLYTAGRSGVFGCILLHGIGNLSVGLVPIILSKMGALILILVLSLVSALFIFNNRKVMLLKPEKTPCSNCFIKDN